MQLGCNLDTAWLQSRCNLDATQMQYRCNLRKTKLNFYMSLAQLQCVTKIWMKADAAYVGEMPDDIDTVGSSLENDIVENRDK